MTGPQGAMLLFGALYVGRDLIVMACRPRPRPRPARRTWADDQ